MGEAALSSPLPFPVRLALSPRSSQGCSPGVASGGGGTSPENRVICLATSQNWHPKFGWLSGRKIALRNVVPLPRVLQRSSEGQMLPWREKERRGKEEKECGLDRWKGWCTSPNPKVPPPKAARGRQTQRLQDGNTEP